MSVPYPAARASPPSPEWKLPSAVAIGSHAADSTSQTRKTSTPTATAFNIIRRRGAGRRSRPIGNPSRIVAPAIRPSTSVFSRLTGGTPRAVRLRAA